MPITTQCPNPDCGKVLSVPDQFANRQGKCPSCGTVVLFAAAPPEPVPVPLAEGPPPLPAAPGEPASAVYADDAPAPYVPPPGGADDYKPVPLNPDVIPLICLGAGVFFLLLLVLCTFLPWRHYSGITLGNAILLLVLVLAMAGLAGIGFVWKGAQPAIGVLVGGFGTFCILFFFSELILPVGMNGARGQAPSAGAGLIIGLIGSLFVTGAFVTLSVFRPLDWPFLKTLNGPPFVQRFGPMLAAEGAAFMLGLVYLIVMAIAR